ncbi:YceI family protein [Helicobacter cappadocius]|uniref:YceI family protein n=1 Tax=Helicobacter cappadocius TaxID=3063998 RepID=A0AA90PQT5_9HELI|nr:MULTISPECIES: YceI family protein [unclassified Helicobacter]MDO7252540.1 YceI family protein [Helicobacter sp. faydin-H75]MDP2538407.1 YceI family protein [Helicobacter sp. faydin-H76]
MKRILLALTFVSIFGHSLNALTIDTASAKVYFVGYKLKNKTKVPGFIDGAVFTFVKTEGSISDIMSKAKATADFSKENTKDKTRDGNIHRTFIAKLKDSKIQAEVTKISGDDSSGEITAKITFNGITKEVPMKYTLTDGKFKASGKIDMSKDFNLNNSYVALSTDKMVSALHGKQTYTEVEIGFQADIK